MPDDHSKSVPPLPIPNRTVKRYYADDSAATSVKVGYRQASYSEKTPHSDVRGFFTSAGFIGQRSAFGLVLNDRRKRTPRTVLFQLISCCNIVASRWEAARRI